MPGPAACCAPAGEIIFRSVVTLWAQLSAAALGIQIFTAPRGRTYRHFRMMRVCLLMASVSSVAGQGLSLGAVTLIRDIEGENARTITRAKATERNAELSASMTAPKLMFDSAVCTQALVDLHATYPRVTVVQLELSEDVSSAPVALAGDVSAGSASHVGWSRPGSFLPYDANKGTVRCLVVWWPAPSSR
jgi:hypothetical protein